MTDLAGNLRAVRARIDAAARSAGRDPSSVALLAVSKTWPADDVRALAALGQRDFGENRAQELIAKAPELADLPLRWHFIGQLQRNKAAAVARLGAVVHTVDRESLVRALDRVGRDGDRPVEVLVQVDLGGAAGELASRGGAAPGDVPALADVVAESPGAAAARADGGRAAGGGPGAGVRPPGRAGRPRPGRPSGGRGAVGGHERGPRGGRRGRRDDRACRNRVVRRSPPSLR